MSRRSLRALFFRPALPAAFFALNVMPRFSLERLPLLARRLALFAACLLLAQGAAAAEVQSPASGERAEPFSIFVYGDSLTFGWVYEPQTKIVSRLPRAQTWPAQMMKALAASGKIKNCCSLEVDALGGRTTDLDEKGSPGSGKIPGAAYNGLFTLPSALSAHMPSDLVIIMLGSNDFARHHNRTAKETAQALARLVACVRQGKWQRRTAYRAPRVLIVLPPAFDGDKTPYGDFFSGSLGKMKDWAPVVEKAVREAGADFLDAGPVTGMPDQPDNVHFTAQECADLGRAVAAKVEEMYGALPQ